MKSLVAASLVAALGTLFSASPARACEPVPTCGRQFCWQPNAVIRGTVLDVPATTAAMTEVKLLVEEVYGQAMGVTAGNDVTLQGGITFMTSDIGQDVIVLTQADATDSPPFIAERYDPSDSFTNECFGPDAGAADIAGIVLSPDCYQTLTPVEPSPSSCRTGCDASGGGAGALASVAAMLMMLQLRRRRRVPLEA